MSAITITPAIDDPFIKKNLKVSEPKKDKNKVQFKVRRARIWAVDFDGTLSRGRYPAIGTPNLRLIETLKMAKACGVRLILWTCREGNELDNALAWCTQYGLYFDAVNDNLPEFVTLANYNPRKIYADLYIDDQAFPYWGDGEQGDPCKLLDKI